MIFALTMIPPNFQIEFWTPLAHYCWHRTQAMRALIRTRSADCPPLIPSDSHTICDRAAFCPSFDRVLTATTRNRSSGEVAPFALHILCCAPLPRTATSRLDCSASTPPSYGVTITLLGIVLMVLWTVALSSARACRVE
jgi:hypothetical protein